jgi:hypothetical protein
VLFTVVRPVQAATAREFLVQLIWTAPGAWYATVQVNVRPFRLQSKFVILGGGGGG